MKPTPEMIAQMNLVLDEKDAPQAGRRVYYLDADFQYVRLDLVSGHEEVVGNVPDWEEEVRTFGPLHGWVEICDRSR